MCNSDIDKAESLNKHFYSVSGKLRKKQLCLMIVSPFESIPSLSIEACGVLSQLMRFNPNKAHGPDELSPQLLMPLADEVGPALTIIVQQSYDCSLPRTGILLLLHPSSKRQKI